VPTLNTAVALKQIHIVTVTVAEDLHLNVPAAKYDQSSEFLYGEKLTDSSLQSTERVTNDAIHVTNEETSSIQK